MIAPEARSIQRLAHPRSDPITGQRGSHTTTGPTCVQATSRLKVHLLRFESVPPTRVDEAAGLTVAEVIHRRFTTLPASATVGDVRDWFAESPHRRMAVLADAGRYVGSLEPVDVTGDVDPASPAAEVAHHGPTVAPDAPASSGEELALLTDARRVPVVDREGHVVGILSVTTDLKAFCGTG
jgi:CBS domain-containing protein